MDREPCSVLEDPAISTRALLAILAGELAMMLFLLYLGIRVLFEERPSFVLRIAAFLAFGIWFNRPAARALATWAAYQAARKIKRER